VRRPVAALTRCLLAHPLPFSALPLPSLPALVAVLGSMAGHGLGRLQGRSACGEHGSVSCTRGSMLVEPAQPSVTAFFPLPRRLHPRPRVTRRCRALVLSGARVPAAAATRSGLLGSAAAPVDGIHRLCSTCAGRPWLRGVIRRSVLAGCDLRWSDPLGVDLEHQEGVAARAVPGVYGLRGRAVRRLNLASCGLRRPDMLSPGLRLSAVLHESLEGRSRRVA
jgi:hypothetical protein